MEVLCEEHSLVSCDKLLEALWTDLQNARAQFLTSQYEAEQQHLTNSISWVDLGDRLKGLQAYLDRIEMDYACRVDTILNTVNEDGDLKENYNGTEVQQLLYP
jgi:hypothetical protein